VRHPRQPWLGLLFQAECAAACWAPAL